MLSSQSLQSMWGLINSLQIVVSMPLLSLSFPANVQLMFSLIIQIATFSLFSTVSMDQKLFNFSPDVPLNGNFNAMDIF